MLGKGEEGGTGENLSGAHIHLPSLDSHLVHYRQCCLIFWLPGEPATQNHESFRFILFCFNFIVVQVQLSHFPTTTFSSPIHLHLHPQSYPLLALSFGPLYMFLDNPSPFFPCYLPPPPPLVTVSLFFISMSLVIFCLFVCFVD